jgi:hypothetical protein
MDMIHSISKDPEGPILNALDLPSPPSRTCEPPPSLSTDLAAFSATLDRPYCNENYPYPYRSMRWQLCGLKHANTRFHVDFGGFSTHAHCRRGAKLWFLATMVDGHDSGEIDAMMPCNYNLDLPPGKRWAIEVVPVLPGSTL